MIKWVVLAAVPFVIGLVLWTLGSFVAWNMNPGDWGEAGRVILACLWVFGSGAVAMEVLSGC